MPFSHNVASWLQTSEQRLSTYPVVDRNCGRISLTLRVGDPQTVRWVERALTPLLDSHNAPFDDSNSAPLHFDYLYDDGLVAQLTQYFVDHDQYEVDDDVNPRGSYRCDYADGLTAILVPSEGIAMHLDMTRRRFLFVHSTRTRWPGIQFGDMVYEPLLRATLNSGAIPLHAGAVSTEQGAILIVGYGGDGKTSMVTGLMRAGAAFTANERTFVQQVDSRWNAHSFPDWINLGLGTVMNAPDLTDMLPVPDRISVPQGRFDWGRPQRYDRSEWPHLDDKVTLLCDELSTRLNAPAPISGCPIVGIVRPKVTRRPIDARLTPIEGDELGILLDDNVSALSHYPDWMGWHPTEAEPDIDSLMQLPALRFRFYLDEGHVQGMHNVLEELHAALHAERRRKATARYACSELTPI